MSWSRWRNWRGCARDSDYELHRLSQERPELLETIAEQQTESIRTEIAMLEEEARRLGDEIEGLTGALAPGAD